MRRHAFTVIELAVSVGVVLILLGLLAPVLRSARFQAAQTRAASGIKQSALLIEAYTIDNRAQYPIGAELITGAIWHWPRPLIAGGYLASERVLDPWGAEHFNGVTFAMSAAMCYDPDFMVRGRTRPVELARTEPVRTDQVVFPAAKGLVVKQVFELAGSGRSGSWCCDEPTPAPVAMADTSVRTIAYTDLAGGQPVYQENFVGLPVLTTWNGFRGRDAP